MKEKENPWLPWKETLKIKFVNRRGRVLVIIPTAGNDTEMLKRCLDSLKFASHGEKIRIIIVLSPSTPKKKNKIEKLFRNVEIIALKGKFNYCRSINEGLSMKDKEDKFVLLLNDDVTFTKRGDLHKLKITLLKRKWACIGPFINYNPNRNDPTWPKEKSSLGFIPKTSGSVRTNLPVSGSCSLWDLEWLNRIGKLDEKFGEGWGMDEADLCLRALRLGARYGRQDSVSINHVMHATFGEKFTQYTGPAHMKSLNYFRKKYGKEIEEWGKSHHWLPLPGVQVLVFPCKNPKKFERSLIELEKEFFGFKWILLFASNLKDKEITKVMKSHCKKTSADKCIIKKFLNKNSRKEMIKKSIIKKFPIREQYPAICLFDTNKKTSNICLRDLLWQIRDKGVFAGKIGNKETLSERIFPDIDFFEFKSKDKKGNYKSCSIFHINIE